MTRITEALDRQCTPLPESLLLDIFYDLLERDGVPADPADDDEFESRTEEIYAWARAHGVRVRV